jgi:hypothetical protein
VGQGRFEGGHGPKRRAKRSVVARFARHPRRFPQWFRIGGMLAPRMLRGADPMVLHPPGP